MRWPGEAAASPGYRSTGNIKHIAGVLMTVPFLVCAATTAISAIVSLGFSIAAVLGETGNARTIALYASARSLALVIVSAVPLITRSTEWLFAPAWATIIVQARAAVFGTTIKHRLTNIEAPVHAHFHL